MIELLKEHEVLPQYYFAGRRRVKNAAGTPKNENAELNRGVRKCGRRVELSLID